MQLFINNWSTSLTVAATAEAVSLSVPPVEAAKLVGLGTGDYYLLTLFEVDSLTGEELRREIVRCTAAAGGSLTVTRAQEGTAAQVWDVGTVIEARLTKETMETLRDSGGAALSDAAPGPLGAAAPGVSTEASRADHVHPTPAPADIGAATAAQGAKADTAIQASEKGAASGVATLGSDSKIPLAQLPATAITSTFVVNTEAAMLALSAQEGDVAVRPDISKSFILKAEPSSTLANWQELLSPAAGGGAPVGSDTPQPLGTPSPGVSSSASRQDHVHAMPSAAAVGADPAGSAAAAQAVAVQRANHTGTQATSTITGLDAALAAKLTNPMTAAGDIIIGGASGAPQRLAPGANDKVLKMVAGAPAWADPAGGVSLPVVRAITGNETLGLAHINTFNVNSTGTDYTVTIQPQSAETWTADAEIHFLPTSTGNIVITAGAGVSLNGVVAGSITLSTAFGAASIKRIASDSWWLGGVAGQTGASGDWCAAGGTANTYTLTPVVARESYVTGDQFRTRFSVTNTGATTVNVSGLGTKTCVTVTGAALPAGYIRTDADTVLSYDGTNFVVDRLVERGSNANGEYVRYADGTQICKHTFAAGSANVASGSVFRTPSSQWTYPSVFISTPAVSVRESSGFGFCWGALGSNADTTTQTSISVFSAVTTTAVTATMTAIGRWF